MKHILVLLFALGITMAITTTVVAQDSDSSAGSAGSVDECRPLLTPEGAAPDTSTCAETQGQLVANYRGTTVSDIDKNEDTAGAVKALLKAQKKDSSQGGDSNEGDK